MISNMVKLVFKTYLVLTYCSLAISSEEDSNLIERKRVSGEILSRQKRYLMFPEGSSFQMVICEQNHGYLQLGNIVWFANTAALAWELPSDPKYFHIFKEHEKDFIQNRNGVSKSIYLLDEAGKVLSKIPYHKKFIVNPAFAKRSVAEDSNVDRSLMHEKQKNASYLQDLDSNSVEFHRNERKDLYQKIEGFLRTLGLNGQECVLRMLCETGQGRPQQGTFFEEIMRATFTFPQGTISTDHLYDKAHTSQDDCGILYPNCEIALSHIN
ncbi:unnamed protein product [Leptosia nina]|uniref:Uncharacterized protein n=1 Tax=Leptosia nina TaxID=320188 RepID=A0AAV1IYT7_9NEOP